MQLLELRQWQHGLAVLNTNLPELLGCMLGAASHAAIAHTTMATLLSDESWRKYVYRSWKLHPGSYY